MVSLGLREAHEKRFGWVNYGHGKNASALPQADCTTEATARTGLWELGDPGVSCRFGLPWWQGDNRLLVFLFEAQIIGCLPFAWKLCFASCRWTEDLPVDDIMVPGSSALPCLPPQTVLDAPRQGEALGLIQVWALSWHSYIQNLDVFSYVE